MHYSSILLYVWVNGVTSLSKIYCISVIAMQWSVINWLSEYDQGTQSQIKQTNNDVGIVNWSFVNYNDDDADDDDDIVTLNVWYVISAFH
jgi:hypothetical protein